MTQLDEEIRQRILDLPDDKFMELAFTMDGSGFFGGGYTRVEVDSDGFPVSSYGAYGDDVNAFTIEGIKKLQNECWRKFNRNPQISTAVTDNAGIVCGKGFSISHTDAKINEFLRKIIYDVRNRLFENLKKMYTRSEIEGELFIAATIHTDGFVELDFMNPGALVKTFYHPMKANFPLYYEFQVNDDEEKKKNVLIPSVFVLEFDDLIPYMRNRPHFKQNKDRVFGKSGVHKKTGGFKTFIISWDKSLFTERNVSQMSTTIEWANHYENLKRYEIDHKRSSGAYLWTVVFEDVKAFKRWASLSDEEKEKTGLSKQKTPGGTLFLPPGMKLEVKNPQLSKISESDTDILHMITSGLNKPEDMVTGQSNGTYGSVKASRGPESDRNENRKYDFEMFLRYTFFKYIFFLSSKYSKMELETLVDVVVDFKKGKEIKGKVKRYIWETLEITFPVSAVSDLESMTKALLGVKHGSLVDVLGIPPSVIAEKLGFSNYKTLRCMNAAEEENYPKLAIASDVDSDTIDGTTESSLLEKKKTKNSDAEEKDEKQRKTSKRNN